MEVLNDQQTIEELYNLMKEKNENNKNCDILKVPKSGLPEGYHKNDHDIRRYKMHCINLYLERVSHLKFNKPKPEDYEDYEYYNNKRDNEIKKIKNSNDTYYYQLENYNTSSIKSVDTNENYGTLFIQLGKPKWNSKSLSDSFNLNNCNAFKQSLSDNYILDNIWRVRKNFSAENYMVNPEYNKARIIEFGHSPDNTNDYTNDIELINQHNALVQSGFLSEGGKRKSRRRLKRTSRKSNKKATKKSKKSRKSRKIRR